MSQNIYQVFTNNPASSMVSTDLLYLGRSPYDTTDDFAITFANFVASIGTATPTASTISKWDASVNFSANNFIPGYQTIATAATLTTLAVTSPQTTVFTGSTTQTCKMPVVSTLLVPGVPYVIINNSTGVVTVESSGANTIIAMAAGTSLLLQNNAITGTTASVWNIIVYSYQNTLPGLQWVSNSTTAFTAVLGQGYTCTFAGTATITLPAPAANSMIGIAGKGGIWTANLAGGTTLVAWGNTYSTSIAAANNTDTVILMGLSTTEWSILSGNTTVYTVS